MTVPNGGTRTRWCSFRSALRSEKHPLGVEIAGACWGAWLSLDWKFGQVWADSYKPGRTARGPHGAAEYLAEFPGTVTRLGLPPRYVPRRRRRR
jgi:hypothetical protein